MRLVGVILLAMILTGCAQPAAPVSVLPEGAPFTAMVQTKERPIRAAQVLSGEDADYFTARAEKGAYGPLPLWALSSYSIYTYDSQRISSRLEGSGYRFRMMWQQGVFAPL